MGLHDGRRRTGACVLRSILGEVAGKPPQGSKRRYRGDAILHFASRAGSVPLSGKLALRAAECVYDQTRGRRDRENLKADQGGLRNKQLLRRLLLQLHQSRPEEVHSVRLAQGKE